MQNRLSNHSLGIFNHGDITIEVHGRTEHSPSEIRTFAETLAQLMGFANIKGSFKVKAFSTRLKGAAKLQGLSVKGINRNDVVLGYQPGSNDTCFKYALGTSPSETKNIYSSLKNVIIGSAYTLVDNATKAESLGQNLELITREQDKVVSSESDAAVVSDATSVVSVQESVKVFYTADPAWVKKLIEDMWFFAEELPERQISKVQVMRMIFERTTLRTLFLAGPIFRTIKGRGYLAEVKGSDDLYTVVDSPDLSVKKHKKTAKKKPAKKAVAKKTVKVEIVKVQPQVKPTRGAFLSDEEWMRSFMAGLKQLVAEADGLVSKTDLHRFIMTRTNQKKIAGTVYSILGGLQLRGLVITAGEKLYRVVYEPKPNTLEKAVEGIKEARAETAKVFDGMALYRLPKFAEGMFDNLTLLDRLLNRMGESANGLAFTCGAIAEDYPGYSQTSYGHLVKYLCTHGYLLNLKHGKYTLGPKGRERLGLPAVKHVVVDKVASPPTPVVVDPPVTQTPPKEVVLEAPASLQSFLPANVVASVGGQALTGQIAKIIGETVNIKREADVSVGREITLRARKAELEAKRAAPVDPDLVEAEVQRKLLALID